MRRGESEQEVEKHSRLQAGEETDSRTLSSKDQSFSWSTNCPLQIKYISLTNENTRGRHLFRIERAQDTTLHLKAQ